METIEVRTLEPGDMPKFVNLAFSLYKGDAGWVAPLAVDQTKMLGGGSHFLSSTEHAFMMAYKAGVPCGRIIVGKYEGMRKDADGMAYISFPPQMLRRPWEGSSTPRRHGQRTEGLKALWGLGLRPTPTTTRAF